MEVALKDSLCVMVHSNKGLLHKKQGAAQKNTWAVSHERQLGLADVQ